MKKPPFTRNQLTVELAREWFAYDPVEGCVIRIKNPARGLKVAGQKAANYHPPTNTMKLTFRGLTISEHHMVWALCRGYWSPHALRHRDDNRRNNHIENLVEMTNASDSYNELQTESSPETGTWSGVVKSPTGSYKAQIFRGKMYHLGTFKTPEEAHMVYLRAKHVLHSPLNRGIPTEELLAQVLK